MKKWGLERGMNSKLTGAKHQDTKQFYKDLPEKILEKKAEIEQLQENVKELKKEVRIDNAWKTVTEVVDGFAKRKENKQKEAEILTLREKVNELTFELKKSNQERLKLGNALKDALVNYNKAMDEIQKLRNSMNIEISKAMHKVISLINSKLIFGGWPFRIEGRGNSSGMVIDINRTDEKGLNKGRGMTPGI
jgi:SMC interacting uncharacterized protein involved in chromosome segregation